MLDFVASRSYSVGFVHWKIRFFAADHGFYDAAVRTRPKKVFKESRRTAKSATSGKKEAEKSKRCALDMNLYRAQLLTDGSTQHPWLSCHCGLTKHLTAYLRSLGRPLLSGERRCPVW